MTRQYWYSINASNNFPTFRLNCHSSSESFAYDWDLWTKEGLRFIKKRPKIILVLGISDIFCLCTIELSGCFVCLRLIKFDWIRENWFACFYHSWYSIWLHLLCHCQLSCICLSKRGIYCNEAMKFAFAWTLDICPANFATVTTMDIEYIKQNNGKLRKMEERNLILFILIIIVLNILPNWYYLFIISMS